MHFIKSVARTSFCISWTLVAAEIFLRIFHPATINPRHVVAGHFGLRVNEPRLTYTHSSADYRITIHTNAEGMRCDRDITYEKRPGVKRIVVLGDSFGMGYEVSYEDMFTSRMETYLREAGLKAEVVNLSVSGYGTAEELLMLQNEGIKYHPDLVLLCFHVSDYKDNVRCGLFALRNGELCRENTQYLPGVRVQAALYRVPCYAWISEKLNLYSFVREWATESVIKPMLVHWSEFVRGGGAAIDSDSGDDNPNGGYRTDLTVSLLRRTEEVAHAAGAKFMILDIPVRRTRTEFYSMFPRVSRGHAVEFGEVVSPLAKFEQHRGELLYWEHSQGHFTPLACRLVGEVLAEHIKASELLR